jgi:DNA-binding IclR family transcriptional regulator
LDRSAARPAKPVPRAQTRSLLRGLAALEYVALAGEVGVAEVAAALALPRASAHILLSTLTDAGYLRQPRWRGGYRVDLKVLNLTQAALRQMPVRERAAPVLHDLASRTGLSTYLAVWFRGQAMTIDRIVPRIEPEARSDLGYVNPAYTSSMGKAMLAYMPSPDLEAYLKAVTLKPLTERTITSRDALRDELQRIRDCGYALSEGEHLPGVRSVGAPVLDYEGQVVAAICVRHYIPFGHRPDEALTRDVVSAAQVISHSLGYGAKPM